MKREREKKKRLVREEDDEKTRSPLAAYPFPVTVFQLNGFDSNTRFISKSSVQVFCRFSALWSKDMSDSFEDVATT